MIRLIGVWLVGCALFVTPVAADEDQYDGRRAASERIESFSIPESVLF